MAVEQDDLSDFDGDCAVGKGQEATLLASLLDGSLVAIGKASGKVTWSLADEPVSCIKITGLVICSSYCMCGVSRV